MLSFQRVGHIGATNISHCLVAVRLPWILYVVGTVAKTKFRFFRSTVAAFMSK